MPYTIKTDYAHRSNYGSYRSPSRIKYIVWHYTANDGDTDESNARFFKSPNRKASAHYFVDDDSVTISVPDTYTAWSVGGSRYADYKKTGGAMLYKIAANSNTLNIELCDTIRNGIYDVSPRTLENAIRLTGELMKKYNIPIANVIRHFDITGKKCPAYYVDSHKWNAVKQKISASSDFLSSSAAGYVYHGIDYKRVFDPIYYSNKYPDLKKAFGTDAARLFQHFTSFGMKEGRSACDSFDVNQYKNHNADLSAVFGSDLFLYYTHYVIHGYQENRKCV